MPLLPTYVSIQGFCEQTSVSRSTVYRMLAAGDIRAKKIGRRSVIDLEHGLRFFQNAPAAKLNRASRRAA